jgi:energy-coupling factor transporter ATP-binding protein EcfA2
VIETVTIRGFKCLYDVSARLGPFNVLIGDNDSGKTSFLQALAWAASQHFPPGVRGSMTGLAIDIGVPGEWRCFLREPTVPVPSRDMRALGQSAGHGFVFETFISGQLPVVTKPATFDPILIAQDSPRNSGATAPFVHERGLGTGAHLARIALGDRTHYDAIQEELRRVTNGRIQEYVVGEDSGNGYPLSFRLYDGRIVPAIALSQGLLVYLAFLALVHRSDRPDVVLIEEPERSVHPLRQREIVQLLRRLNEQNVQVVMTTHSPDLLSACEPHEVRVFLRPDPASGTEIHELPKDFDAIRMRETLGQIWASRGEQGLLDLLPPLKPKIRATGG